MNQNLTNFQQHICYAFQDEEKLHQALIHRSYINENKTLNLSSNERYEFLGDAVLELWASKTLFNLFPQYNEGNLTNLRAMVVRTETLAELSKEIKINEIVLLSKGEESHGGRENSSILADTFEAVIGAIFLDSNLENADKFLDKFLLPVAKRLAEAKVYKDPKSLFQEIAQAKKGITPHYTTLSESGPDHQKIFEVGAYIGDELIATGSGPSKQAAEEQASTKATKMLTNLV